MRARRILGLAGLVAITLLMSAPGARADQLSSEDLAAAKAAADDPTLRAEISRFFTQTGGSGHSPSVSAVGESFPVYELSRDFVAGDGAGAGQLAYVAVPVTASDGQTATVWSVRGDDGVWRVGNIASGDRESELARRLPAGATLLHEPQVDAWYALRDGRVTLLDPGAGGYATGASATLAEYQKTVSGRYGAMLAGSPYAQEGKAGGYNAQVMPRGDGGPAPDAQDTGFVPLLIFGGLLLIGIAGFFLHSKRRVP
ncbi:hypothetical protein [Amycolatopsis regifaucium]|uniref:Uncharacterized protein n=1 Tax=Amycolatopsis regifaucium TaxID=546365 RepID=A0A154MU80_9PSEU|nr:hypothetical protein [Amycolatopsis regifaucium]KZB87670.1 hypothetical protein AVL48_24005 [Amycolatopsis regifaucium]OKA05494.1 hypothetical protein ATP06_0225720 [Amycolatopsis regifaucium]SFI12509.1 hypothetical protein SAMN04489731_108278 [Amycolatopsis regifaucium]